MDIEILGSHRMTFCISICLYYIERVCFFSQEISELELGEG